MIIKVKAFARFREAFGKEQHYITGSVPKRGAW